MMTTTSNCGLYAIECIVNDRIYIGSSTDINKRIIQHKFNLSNNKHHNPDLQADWVKHGSNKFNFYSLEACDMRELRWKELVYIYGKNWLFDLYNLPTIKDRITYNICKQLDNFEVDKRIRFSDGKYYCFNIVCGDVYINLRDDTFDPDKSADSYARKAEYVNSIGGRLVEYCYNSNLSETEVQEIVDSALSHCC